MIKLLSSLIILSGYILASEYYSKIEPIRVYDIKSAVSGKVIYVNNRLESHNIESEIILQIDDKINQIDLKQSNLKLKTFKEILSIEKRTLEKFKKVSSKSIFDKDNQRIKILNISANISDLETKVATLKDMISKKVLTQTKSYIYNIAVETGDYVNPGTLLYTAMDLSKGKVIIYLPIDTIKDIRKKTIYIDDKKTNLKITKLYKVADKKHISSYKCEINIPFVNKFSKLVKIEFK
jgi:multidrug resistance efflux pump